MTLHETHLNPAKRKQYMTAKKTCPALSSEQALAYVQRFLLEFHAYWMQPKHTTNKLAILSKVDHPQMCVFCMLMYVVFCSCDLDPMTLT